MFIEMFIEIEIFWIFIELTYLTWTFLTKTDRDLFLKFRPSDYYDKVR
jgi:hypothetical protein